MVKREEPSEGVVVEGFRHEVRLRTFHPMVTRLNQTTPHTIKIEYVDEPVTSFGGLALAERLGQRLRLWSTLGGLLPSSDGYAWVDVVKGMVLGLLSGSQGTYATQGLREDAALLSLLSLAGAPEEATVWRRLAGLGRFQSDGLLPRAQLAVARRTLGAMRRGALLLEGFVPVFGDGSLLEGSARREGTKTLRDKGRGLLWTTVFVGPVLAAQRLAGEGEGEQSCLRAMMGAVKRSVLKPLGLAGQALVLTDSLHGDEPTLRQWEAERLHYLSGANKLERTASTLAALPDALWQDTGPRGRLKWSQSAVCSCWLQCEGWAKKRLLVGRRWMRQGEMIWNYAGVLTDLRERDVRGMLDRGLSFEQAIWRLYDAKAGMETYYKDGLSDLGLHHPPCQEHARNSGFFAVAALAWLLATAVDVLGGQSPQRGSETRLDGGQRKRPQPRRMRLWRLRRELFALPGRVRRHAHEMVVQLLGLSARSQEFFGQHWGHICRA